MRAVSYPTRQRNRRLGRALESATAALLAFLLAGLAARAGWSTLAVLLVLGGAACGLSSRHWLRLARRSAIGERSERRVREQLQSLEREGWTVRHSLGWQGGGDIDHLAIAPAAIGLAFPIETKTRRYTADDLARIQRIAGWMVRPRSGWSTHGAIPILCLAGAQGVERWEDGVAVVSPDLLIPVLSRLAGTTRKPGFLR